jgi:hypothetical protein
MAFDRHFSFVTFVSLRLRSVQAFVVENDFLVKNGRALFQLLVRVWMVAFVSLRTGEMFDASTARFAVMAATIFSQDQSPPQVACQLEQFFRQRHGLVQIGQKVAE